jgi:predicted nuclease of predicted toxin-antitoxin system
MASSPDPPALRLLIDACLTPAVVSHLSAAFGPAVDAVHVDAVLPPATADQAVLAWAAQEARIVVTANIADFSLLASRTMGHPGLVLVEDQNTKVVQIAAVTQVIGAMIAWAAANGDPAGHVFTWRNARGGRLAVRRLP